MIVEKIKCGNCHKNLKPGMEVEYSKFFTEYFCSADCAQDFLFNAAECTPIDFTNYSSWPNGLFVISGYLRHLTPREADLLRSRPAEDQDQNV